jgi:Do/DeqQ family serine protease
MKTLKIVLAGFLGGLAGAYLLFQLVIAPQLEKENKPEFDQVAFNNSSPFNSAPVENSSGTSEASADFSEAASKAIPSVVYINSISQGASYSYWDMFFGGGAAQTRVSSGSGVIFSQDGYIVTNNHVVASAEKLEVLYNKRSYPAELVGTDPSTDLAVLKINDTDLPAVTLGNSNSLQVGEWVVAVGNPFSLASTVTVGIVSAKGRRIGILEDKFPIESFIQTDAAINPGNSGGALVNKKGELVGINTAILSRTGSYTGYAFAIPIDIAKKVVDDLIKYGVVQKALIGGNVIDYDYQNAKKYGLETNVKSFNGVLLEKIEQGGPIEKVGLKPGDIITKINATTINTKSAFEEELSYRYPGDKISLTYTREGKTTTADITLVNRDGNTEKVKRKIYVSNIMGAQLEATDYGIKVFKISEVGYMKRLGIPENYTIISINRVRVKDPQEVIDFFEKYKGRASLYGMNGAREVIPYNFILK